MTKTQPQVLIAPPPRRVIGRPGAWITLQRGEPPRRTSILDMPPSRRTWGGLRRERAV